MRHTISNRDSVIDSRDIIERMEELQSEKDNEIENLEEKISELKEEIEDAKKDAEIVNNEGDE